MRGLPSSINVVVFKAAQNTCSFTLPANMIFNASLRKLLYIPRWRLLMRLVNNITLNKEGYLNESTPKRIITAQQLPYQLISDLCHLLLARFNIRIRLGIIAFRLTTSGALMPRICSVIGASLIAVTVDKDGRKVVYTMTCCGRRQVFLS